MLKDSSWAVTDGSMEESRPPGMVETDGARDGSRVYVWSLGGCEELIESAREWLRGFLGLYSPKISFKKWI